VTAPSVSVVIIVKDGERFLQDAIDSVFAQTVPPMELIIVDDGSTDRTPEIIDHAIATSADGPTAVRVLRHPGRGNRGMSRSRNLGLANARGTFTTFLDHDDALLPRKLEVMTKALAGHPDASAVIGPNRRWRSWSGGRDDDQAFGVPVDVVLPPPGLLPRFLPDSAAVPLGPLLRTESIRALHGYVERFRGMHEDQAFLARLMLQRSVVVIDDVLHLYRQHETSCVARTHHEGRDLQARRQFLDWLGTELDSNPAADSELGAVVRAERNRTRGWLRRRLRRALINFRGRPSAG
jgi:glycosyltransferase involved in cell wall biosynthesis